MKKLVIIILVIFIVGMFFIPQMLSGDNPEHFDDKNSIENQVSSIWVILKHQARLINQLRNVDSTTVINEGDTIIQNNIIVEYAPHTNGVWSEKSYITSKYRRTGYTYEGITTYVVEKISFCWNDENTMMFIVK